MIYINTKDFLRPNIKITRYKPLQIEKGLYDKNKKVGTVQIFLPKTTTINRVTYIYSSRKE